MADTLDGRGFEERLQRLESLLQAVQSLTDPQALGQTQELVQAVLDLHAEGLKRMLDHLAARGETGKELLAIFAQDEVASGLLLLHGLHPLDLKTRVLHALDRVRPLLHSHGGNVELVGVTEDGTIRLRLLGSCHGCRPRPSR